MMAEIHWNYIESHKKSWKIVEYSVSVTIYHHVLPGGVLKLLEFFFLGLYQLSTSYKGLYVLHLKE